MNASDFLSRLQKVRKTSRDSWVACCPAHEDRSPSMTVKETPETILIHCFAGCSTESILGAVGMTFDDLYPDHRETVKPGKLSANDALRCIAFEALVAAASAGTMRERSLTEDEVSRLMQASSRIQAALDMAGVTQ